MNQKRYAVASALAATAVPALVMARGHRVEDVPELPLVVDTSLETCTKTTSALATLTALGAAAEVEKVRYSGHFYLFGTRATPEKGKKKLWSLENDFVCLVSCVWST